ncbi:MAG: prolipoprotein diacylglyceryl transferase [Chloroflexi bacterium]|nr:prolipoprotein diacylglyceryl transferase [Chloroflexota bacterium]MCI0575902.1 prolipoprotein diacylglyceryl transferase [Chloroflexota bacterium]MCI0648303.1 prolipoprotein diacylglyceryl transferase [Chloroflexota bacterium]MCI0727716.1 prolipoprotein diacylglyceryl transferase [Chloroflexota bacterium]
MYPILDRYGPFFLYSFTVVMGLGLAAAIGLTAWLEKRAVQQAAGQRPEWLDGLLLGLAAGLVGGRIGFVWANWPYFQERPGEIGLVWQGGLSYHGALLAGLLALRGWAAWRRRPVAIYAGLLAPGLALGSAFGWLACWLEGCAYGRETLPGLLAADLPDGFGVYGLRYQTQLVGLATCLAALGALPMQRRLPPALLFWLTLLVLSSGRVVVSFLRGDTVPILAGFRLDTWLDGLLSLIALAAVFVKIRERKLLASFVTKIDKVV